MKDRVPIHFGEGGRALFGWFHAAGGATERECGVVLLNPIGDDLVRSHRTYRHLAEALAAAGFGVLRFDFHGTGDSGGSETDAKCVKSWLGDVGAAIDVVRERSGARDVVLVGLRLGATLAAIVGADRGDVDAIVLWSPYENGAAFITDVTRQHKMHKMLEPQSFTGGPAATGGEEALGFFLTNETIADLKGLEVGRERSPARKVLVVGADGPRAEDAILARLSAVGSDAVHRHVPGPKFLIQIPHESTVPIDAIESIVTWLSGVYPTSESVAARPAEPSMVTTNEEPLVFGNGGALFGVLTKPSEVSRRPAVLLINAGTVHRIGPHRLFVGLARRWAALGVPVLRMDLSGIGDSPAANGCPENVCYPQDAVSDVQEAMNHLSERLGVTRFVLGGLCSGADIAFQTGRTDDRVAGVVMLNPRTFQLGDHGDVTVYQRARWYQDAVLKKDSWKKALRGEVDFKRVAGMVAPKVKGVVMNKFKSLFASPEVDTDDVPAQLRSLADRGVDTLLLVTEHDPGVDYVDSQFGARMKALSSSRSFRRVDVAGTDHTFTSLWSQRHVSDLVTEHLARFA